MHYWAIKNESGEAVSLGTADYPVEDYEITEAEYHVIMQEIEVLGNYVTAVYNHTMSINDVPEQYRDRVSTEIDKLIEMDNQPEPMDDIEEALAILSGEVTE